jgi:hypothetical protein
MLSIVSGVKLHAAPVDEYVRRTFSIFHLHLDSAPRHSWIRLLDAPPPTDKVMDPSKSCNLSHPYGRYDCVDVRHRLL